MDISAIPERLKEARKSAGLSVGQASRLSGLEVSDIENGARVSFDDLVRLSGIYGVTLHWIAGEADPTKEIIFSEVSSLVSDHLSAADTEKLMNLLRSL